MAVTDRWTRLESLSKLDSDSKETTKAVEKLNEEIDRILTERAEIEEAAAEIDRDPINMAGTSDLKRRVVECLQDEGRVRVEISKVYDLRDRDRQVLIDEQTKQLAALHDDLTAGLRKLGFAPIVVDPNSESRRLLLTRGVNLRVVLDAHPRCQAIMAALATAKGTMETLLPARIT